MQKWLLNLVARMCKYHHTGFDFVTNFIIIYVADILHIVFQKAIVCLYAGIKWREAICQQITSFLSLRRWRVVYQILNDCSYEEMFIIIPFTSVWWHGGISLIVPIIFTPDLHIPFQCIAYYFPIIVTGYNMKHINPTDAHYGNAVYINMQKCQYLYAYLVWWLAS